MFYLLPIIILSITINAPNNTNQPTKQPTNQSTNQSINRIWTPKWNAAARAKDSQSKEQHRPKSGRRNRSVSVTEMKLYQLLWFWVLHLFFLVSVDKRFIASLLLFVRFSLLSFVFCRVESGNSKPRKLVLHSIAPEPVQITIQVAWS